MQNQPSTNILFFLGIIGLTLFGLGWAIDNGATLPDPQALIEQLSPDLAGAVTSQNSPKMVVEPNDNSGPVLPVQSAARMIVVPNSNQAQSVVPAFPAFPAFPTITPYIPSIESTIPVIDEPVIEPTQQVITVTATLEPIIVVTATPVPIIVVTATPTVPIEFIPHEPLVSEDEYVPINSANFAESSVPETPIIIVTQECYPPMVCP